MELVRGVPLTSFMDGQLPVAARVGIVAQILQALAHMHARNVLHRDIKPENILVERNEHGVLSSRITDFGIASGIELNADDSLGESGHLVIGTPAYMAPERASDVGTAKPTSDLYSVGSMLYEMIVGTLPFTGNPIEVMVKKNPPRGRPHSRDTFGPRGFGLCGNEAAGARSRTPLSACDRRFAGPLALCGGADLGHDAYRFS